ncbi:MAG: hypothetical protein AAFP97_05225 [Pseudomonadota bacterium]
MLQTANLLLLKRLTTYLAVLPCVSVLLSANAFAQAPMQPNEDGDYFPDPRLELPLNEAELRAAFSDKTHRGTYTFSRPNIDTFAFEETTTSDGRTVHKHGDAVDTGTWRVMANVICFRYENYNGGIHNACFNIYKRGNCFYHYGLNSAFGGGDFTARSVHEGEIPECEPPMS